MVKPAKRVFGKVITGNLVGVATAAVAVFSELALSAAAFYHLSDIAKFLDGRALFEDFGQRLFPDVAGRNADPRTRLDIAVGGYRA